MTTPRSPRARRRGIAAIGSAAVLTAFAGTVVTQAAGAASASAAAAPGAVRLADTYLTQVPAMLGGLKYASRSGDAPAEQTLTLGVAVTGTDAAVAAQLAKDQADPTKPAYRHFLTPEQYAAAFGVPADREAAIVDYLKAGGFTVATPSLSGTYLMATATVAQVESLFHVHYGSFFVNNATHFIPFVANEDPPQVPSGLGIAAISGLDTLRQFYRFTQKTGALTPTQQAAAVATARAQATGAALPAANVPVVANATIQPRDLWGVYNQPSTDLGDGQISGIFGEGTTDPTITQLRLFEATQGFPKVPVNVVRTEGDVTNSAAYGDNTGNIEWYLDAQALTGMAPNLARLDLYFAKTLFDADIFQSFSTWANNTSTDTPKQMNASFGECETNPTNPVTGPLAQIPYGTELGNQLEPVGEPILQQAVLEGRTLFASSGDTGSGCPAVVVPVVGAGNGVAPVQPPLPNYPAASAYAVGVGGTVLTIKGSGVAATRNQEASWTDTGGGPSRFIAKPSFQNGVAAVNTSCVSQRDGTPYPNPMQPCRGVPDVAALSGNITGNGYFIYIDGSPSAQGGTSLSSPLTVGMWSRLQAASSNPGGLGFAANALYSLYDFDTKGTSGTYGANFFDVTTEENGATNGAFAPAPGWDYTSGLGVFNVGALLMSLDGTTTARTPAVPAEAPAVAACSATQFSPVGNAVNPADVMLGNDPTLDLTRTRFALDPTGTSMVVTITGPDFVTQGASTGGTTFKAQWLYNGVVYFISANDNRGTVTAVSGDNNAKMSGTAATASLSPDNKVLTLTAPLSALGAPGSGAQLLYPSVEAILTLGAPTPIGTRTVASFATDTASAVSYTQQTVGQAVVVGPCTPEVLTSGPGSVVPEAPAGVLLPVVGGGVGAALVLVLRRRRRTR